MNNLHDIDDNVIGKDTTMDIDEVRKHDTQAMLDAISDETKQVIIDILVDEGLVKGVEKPWPEKHRRWEALDSLDGDFQTVKTIAGKTIAHNMPMVDAQYIVEAHNAALDHNADPKKPSILDEEWEPTGDCGIRSATRDLQVGVIRGSTGIPYRDILVGTPEYLRALVKTRDGAHVNDHVINAFHTQRTITVTEESWNMILAALKKAGIE